MIKTECIPISRTDFVRRIAIRNAFAKVVKDLHHDELESIDPVRGSPGGQHRTFLLSQRVVFSSTQRPLMSQVTHVCWRRPTARLPRPINHRYNTPPKTPFDQ